MRNLSFLQVFTEQFRCFNRNGTDKNRLPSCMSFNNFIHKCLILCLFCSIYCIRIVNTGYRSVCRNFHNIHIVDFQEFLFFCFCCTCHAGKSVVQTEEVLVCDCRKRCCFLLDGNTFFGFYSLMQTIRPLSSFHHTTGVRIDNDDFIIVFINNIVDILFHDVIGT